MPLCKPTQRSLPSFLFPPYPFFISLSLFFSSPIFHSHRGQVCKFENGSVDGSSQPVVAQVSAHKPKHFTQYHHPHTHESVVECYTSVCMCVCMHVHLSLSIFECMYLYRNVCFCVRGCLFVCLYVSRYACVYVCM